MYFVVTGLHSLTLVSTFAFLPKMFIPRPEAQKVQREVAESGEAAVELLNGKYREASLKWPLKISKTKVLNTGCSLVQVESIAVEHSAILLTCIKRLSVLKTYFGVFF